MSERDDDVEEVRRFERRLAHPPEKVWRALTEARELAAWFPGGGARDLAANDHEVIVFDPPRLLAYRFEHEELRWELTPTREGCVLVLTSIVRGAARSASDEPRALALAA